MVVFPGGEAGDDRTVPFDIVNIGNPLTTPACAAIFVGGGQFAIAIGAHGKDELLPLHQLFEAACRHRRFAFLLWLPRGKAQIILALFLLGADTVKNGKRDYLIVLLQCPAPNTCRGEALKLDRKSA